MPPSDRVAQLYLQALGYFSSPSTTRRATAEVFESGSTRGKVNKCVILKKWYLSNVYQHDFIFLFATCCLFKYSERVFTPSGKVKNTWNFTSTPPYAIMVRCLSTEATFCFCNYNGVTKSTASVLLRPA
jgi:hypothetical protein